MSSSGVTQPLERETVPLCSPHLVSSPAPESGPQNNCVLMGEERGVGGCRGGLEPGEGGWRDYQGDGSVLTAEMIRCDE